MNLETVIKKTQPREPQALQSYYCFFCDSENLDTPVITNDDMKVWVARHLVKDHQIYAKAVVIHFDQSTGKSKVRLLGMGGITVGPEAKTVITVHPVTGGGVN